MTIFNWLQQELQLTEAEVQHVQAMLKAQGGQVPDVLNNLGLLNEKSTAKLYSEYYQLHCISEEGLTEQSVQEAEIDDHLLLEHLKQFNLDFLLENQWLPVGQDEQKTIFASPAPLGHKVRQYLDLGGFVYTCSYCSEQQYKELLMSFESLRAKHSTRQVNNSALDNVERLAEEAPTVNLVNSLITRAVKKGSSDLHLEPFNGGYRARIRIDGIMTDLDTLPPALQLAAVSRVKILAGLDISERRRPQDGKIAMKLPGMEFDIRVSVLPLSEGESVVMRFLFKGSLNYELEALGLSDDVKSWLAEDLHRTAGVILLTGPTGSGKTTTLYSFLNQLNNKERKIITLEDPVEYSIEGINQIQVRPEIDFDFSAGLRSVVRQDPDIIMVGEIRDAETAKIAFQSAITGHLVFSTVHTNDAPSAYTRLLELGVDEHLINAGLISAVAQRLVRQLCPDCKQATDKIPPVVQEYMDRCNIESASIYEAVGCESCSHNGYRGRVAIVEYMPCNDMILSLEKDARFKANASKLLRQNGYRSLYEDGLQKVINGVTSVNEVIRVAG